MESLMLLGGQFLQAGIREEYRRDRTAAANRERAYWESFGEPECGVVSVRSVAARVLAATIVLGVFFAGLTATGWAQTQPSFTPFRLAIWSESIGR